MQSLKFCTYEGTIGFFDASSPDGDVSSDTNTPKVGDTLTATVEGAAAASYEWAVSADGEEWSVVETETDETFAVTADLVGMYVKVTVTAEDEETASDVTSSPVYDSLALLSADQTGKNEVTLTTNGPVTALDDIDVLRGSKEVEIDKIDYEDDGAVVTLKDSIVTGVEYTVVLTPADEDDEATSATFTGEKAQLDRIEFLNDYLVLKDNKYQDGFAYVKGYDQFDDEVVLSGLTVTAGVGNMTAYDPETGKITLHSDQENAYMLIKEVPVFVQVQVGNSMVTGSKTLQVSTRSFVDNIVFGDIEKDGTKRDDERLTITELSSGKYYVELLEVEDQYGNTLSADDLNDQAEDHVLFVIPNDTGAFYVTGKFGTINGTTVLWLAAPADGAKPGTMTLTITGAGGKSFTEDITIEDDPYIDTMNITYPELYAGSAKSNTMDFSAVDQYGDEIDLWQFKPWVDRVNNILYFTDENHMTNTGTKMQVSNAVFNVVTDNTAKKEFEVTLDTSASQAKSMAVFTTTTAGTKVYTGSVTIGEKGTALQIKDTFGSSTQLDQSAVTNIYAADGTTVLGTMDTRGSSSKLNINSKIAFEDVNGNTMVRGKDALYPYFTSDDLAFSKTPANQKASDFTAFAWTLTSKKVKDNTTAAPATISAQSGAIPDGDGQIEDTDVDGKGDFYVTLFGTTDNLAGAAPSAGNTWYKIDERSLHVTEVVGVDKNSGYSIVAPGTLYIDKESRHSVTVKVKAKTNSGEEYTVAGDRVKLTLDNRFTVENGKVSGKIGDNWTGDKTGSVDATVWVKAPDGEMVEVGTVAINYTDAAPVATKASLGYKSSVAGSFVVSRVGAEVSGAVSDIELGNNGDYTTSATIENGVLGIVNGNSVKDGIEAKIVDQYDVNMLNTTFYLDGSAITNASEITTGNRGAIEYRSGNVTNKFYFTDDTDKLDFTVKKSTSETVTTAPAFTAAFAEAAADPDTDYTITLGQKPDGTNWTIADSSLNGGNTIPANITLKVAKRVMADFSGVATLTVDGSLVVDGELKAKAITVGSDDTKEGNLTINGTAVTGAISVAKKSTGNNNGSLLVDTDYDETPEAVDIITVDGKFTNSKTVRAYEVTGQGTYTNKKGATTTAIDTIHMVNNTTLENYGKVIAKNISDYVKLGNGSTTIATVGYTAKTTVESGATATLATDDTATPATKLEIKAGSEPFVATFASMSTAGITPTSGEATVSTNGGTPEEIKTPSATVSAVTVSGASGSAIEATDLTLTLTNVKFAAIAAGTPVKSWFTNIPDGLAAAIKSDVAEGGTTAVITISGTPTVGSSEVMAITVPNASISVSQDVTVTANSSAKYAITGTTAAEKLAQAKATAEGAISAVLEENKKSAFSGITSKTNYDKAKLLVTTADNAITAYEEAKGTPSTLKDYTAYTSAKADFTAVGSKLVVTIGTISGVETNWNTDSSTTKTELVNNLKTKSATLTFADGTTSETPVALTNAEATASDDALTNPGSGQTTTDTLTITKISNDVTLASDASGKTVTATVNGQ